MKKFCAFIFSVLLCLSGCGTESTITADFNSSFKGINGCAVFYSPSENKYVYYNEEACNERVSPYSTFKIPCTLIGLENGILDSENSRMEYSGDIYPFDSWNNDLTLSEAFQASCVWYFRQVADRIGPYKMQETLNALDYGNKDISQWEGSGLNEQSDLNGFWLGSSLLISPVEQIKVISDIFEGNTKFSPRNIEILKNIMKAESVGDIRVYGKTGTGKDNSAWFTGFFEKGKNKIYFALYMHDEKAKGIAGADAKAAVYDIIKNNYAVENSRQ